MKWLFWALSSALLMAFSARVQAQWDWDNLTELCELLLNSTNASGNASIEELFYNETDLWEDFWNSSSSSSVDGFDDIIMGDNSNSEVWEEFLYNYTDNDSANVSAWESLWMLCNETRFVNATDDDWDADDDTLISADGLEEEDEILISAPAEAPTAVDCSLCLDGSTPQFPDRNFFGLNGSPGVTCQQLDTQLHNFIGWPSCRGYRGNIATFDAELYCGCPGVTTSNESCEGGLCPSGLVEDLTQMHDGFTCEEWQHLATATIDANFCFFLEAAQAVCCSATTSNSISPQSTPVPTSPTTPPPVASPTSQVELPSTPETMPPPTSDAATQPTPDNPPIVTPQPTAPPITETTPLPTAETTPQPTSFPTPEPTLLMTPEPTLFVTPEPTPFPTLPPTPFPTSPPTPVPMSPPTPPPVTTSDSVQVGANYFVTFVDGTGPPSQPDLETFTATLTSFYNGNLANSFSNYVAESVSPSLLVSTFDEIESSLTLEYQITSQYSGGNPPDQSEVAFAFFTYNDSDLEEQVQNTGGYFAQMTDLLFVAPG